jgi:hypothetical protein
MTLSVKQLRSVVNLLSDSGSAANAAGILTREAQTRGILVADLVSGALASKPPSPPPRDPAPSTAPAFHDIEPVDDGGPYVKVQLPNGDEMWLAKSVVENHGDDRQGRAIFVIPKWLAKRGKLL